MQFKSVERILSVFGQRYSNTLYIVIYTYTIRYTDAPATICIYRVYMYMYINVYIHSYFVNCYLVTLFLVKTLDASTEAAGVNYIKAFPIECLQLRALYTG